MISFEELKQEGCLFERGLSVRNEQTAYYADVISQMTSGTIYMTLSAKVSWLDFHYDRTHHIRALNLTTGLVEEFVFVARGSVTSGVNCIVKAKEKAEHHNDPL